LDGDRLIFRFVKSARDSGHVQGAPMIIDHSDIDTGVARVKNEGETTTLQNPNSTDFDTADIPGASSTPTRATISALEPQVITCFGSDNPLSLPLSLRVSLSG
jgi:hypothetical protein